MPAPAVPCSPLASRSTATPCRSLPRERGPRPSRGAGSRSPSRTGKRGRSRQVAKGDVLPVPHEVHETERALVQGADEALRAAAMLRIWATVGARGGDIGRVPLLKERDEVGRHSRARGAAGLKLSVRGSRPAPLLDFLHGRREGNVAYGL